MKPTPAPASPKVPASQQEAQDTVLRYLQKTVDGLPTGSSLDGRRYAGTGTRTTYCEDMPKDTNSPVHFEDWRDTDLPPGTDFNMTISQVGRLWEEWGWNVIERDEYTKPNRFGYAPDGYILHIQASSDPQYSPSIIGSSPSYPGSLRKDDIPQPILITQSNPAS